MNDSVLDASSAGNVRTYLKHFMTERNVPGLQIAVVKDEKIALLDSLGIADVEHQVPVTDQSIFSINSVAKAFTGVALMQLVEDGSLDLDAPVATYLDDLPKSWTGITIRQLAALQSGLPDIMRTDADGSVGLIGDGSEESAWATAYAMPTSPPGERFEYSQTSFALLGRIITKLAGMPFTEFIATRQLDVAGMTNTRYADDSDIIPGRARTYNGLDASGQRSMTLRNSHLTWHPVLRTAAGLHSTAEDVAKWLIALSSGLLLESDSVAAMHAVNDFNDGRPGQWGIGWLFGNTGTGRVLAPAGGCKAQLAVYPNGVAVVLLTNVIGGFPEQLAAAAGDELDISVLSPIIQLIGDRT